MALSTLPYIKPTTGTSTVFLNWMRRMMDTYSTLAAKQKVNANSILPTAPTPGIKVSEIRMPSLAASRPPEVAGSTNLLRTICCRITPQTDKPTPVSTSAAKRGMRLAVTVSQASPEPDSSCAQDNCLAPTSKEAQHSKTNTSSSKRLEAEWIKARSRAAIVSQS